MNQKVVQQSFDSLIIHNPIHWERQAEAAPSLQTLNVNLCSVLHKTDKPLLLKTVSMGQLTVYVREPIDRLQYEQPPDLK